MLIYLGITLFLLLCLLLFSSPRFSPIPYFPTNRKDIPLIIKGLALKNNQTVVDLGAGDGIVIFEAAKASLQDKLNTQFIAVEINPILVFILHLHRLFHPNRKNIKIIFGDMFKIDFMDFINFKNFITIYLYVSPWLIDKILRHIKKQIKEFSVISYMYDSKLLKNKEKIIKGVHNIYVYN